MKVIAEKSITETLAKAMEQADRIKHVVVISETIDTDDSTHFVIASPDISLAQMNWLADMLKEWCLRQ